MGEIAYTKFGRNALFIGLISHVAALLKILNNRQKTKDYKTIQIDEGMKR